MPTVRVYSKSGDDRSIDVKALLRENGVAYTDYDVEKNPSMKKEALSLTKDKDEFPVVLVDGKVFFGKKIVGELRKELGIKGRLSEMVSPFVKAKRRLEEMVPTPGKAKAPWDYLEPKTFMIAVTSGLPSIDRSTVVEEANGAVGKGIDLMRLDVESHNHLTPKDIDELKALTDSQGMKWAIHADLTIDMTRSEKTDWDHAHNSLKAYIGMAKKLKAVYVNIHSSVNPTPALQPGVGRSYELQVDPDGDKIETLFNDTPEAQDWYVHEQTRGLTKETARRALYTEWQWRNTGEKPDETAQKMIAEWSGKPADEVIRAYRDLVKVDIVKEFDSRVSEWTAYIIVAWSLYKKKDSLWTTFCGKKSPAQILLDFKTDEVANMVDAVAGAYVRGHFKKYLNVIEKDRIIWTLENPDARGGNYRGEKQYRLMHPTHIYHVIKSIGSPFIRLAIDWEHMSTHGFDPWEEAKKFPSDIGEYVYDFDVGSHPNIGHIHHPVERGDINLYKLLWEVRKRGLKQAVILYEWGGGRKPEERWLDSVPALKTMAKMLENDIPPDELPPEFFGITKGEEELEKRIMERNMFKPLEGTLEFPELTHTWFGGELKKKGKLEVWAKEEYR